jgi:hypothetical protein
MDIVAGKSAMKRPGCREIPPILFGSLLAVCAAFGAIWLARIWTLPQYAAPVVLVLSQVVKLINGKKSRILHYAMGSTYFITMILWVTRITNGYLALGAYFLPLFALDAIGEEYLRRRQYTANGVSSSTPREPQSPIE